FLQVSNTREALKRVADGDADAAVDILPVLLHHIDSLSSTPLKLAGVTEVVFPVQVMVRKEHARLIPLINRAIDAITPKEHAAIYQKWSLREVIAAPDYTLMLQVLSVIVAIIILLLFFYWNRMLNRKVRVRTTQLKDELAKREVSEARFRSLFEMSPDPTWIIEDNHFVECNQAAMDMLGYSNRDDLLNVHPAKLSPPTQPDGETSLSKAEKMMEQAKERGFNRFEWVHTRLDGSSFFAEVSLASITIEAKPAIYCTWRDISERKLLEAKNQERDTRFHRLFEETDAISVQGYDKNRSVIYWNHASEQLYGYAARDAMGKKLEDLIIPSEMREGVVAGVTSWLSGGPVIPSSDLTLQKADGSPVEVFSSHVMLQNLNDEPEMFCIDINLTELRQAEQA
ncbi:MAG: PAS domain S-box protein, partial [Gammaproteobacteria bacterium]|nr:PAS domain S-box protein [Gammaproteobacteria bacterium]